MKHFAKSCSRCKYFHKLCLCACSCDVNKSGESREPGLERSRGKRLVLFFIIGIQRAADMTHKHARSGDSSPLGDIFPGLKMQKHIDSAGQQMTPAGERAHSAGPQRARQTLPSGSSGELIINSARLRIDCRNGAGRYVSPAASLKPRRTPARSSPASHPSLLTLRRRHSSRRRADAERQAGRCSPDCVHRGGPEKHG